MLTSINIRKSVTRIIPRNHKKPSRNDRSCKFIPKTNKKKKCKKKNNLKNQQPNKV